MVRGEGLEIFLQDPKITCLRHCPNNFNPGKTLIPTCVMQVTVLKSNVLRLWIFRQEFIRLVTPREGVLAMFVCRGEHAIF